MIKEKSTKPHWQEIRARRQRRDRELLPVEHRVGRVVYACCTNIRVKVALDSHADSYSVELATLFSTKRQMSVIDLSAAIGRELPYRTVPEVEVMLGNGWREKSSRLFFLEVRPHRAVQPLRTPESLLLVADGVSQIAPAAELPLLRGRFNMRPSLTMGDLAQQAGPMELVIGKDYMEYWPVVVDRSQCTSENLYIMKMQFHQG